jgi:hypothetical protein
MAKAAMQEFDKNGDSFLDATELNACPGLKSALAEIDKNNDRKLSPDELRDRFATYKAVGVGAISVGCTVSMNGRPLGGAAVTFTPENCMLGVIKPATATTLSDGSVVDFQIEGVTQPGLPAGLYKVAISKIDAGVEAVPTRYNSSTTLGCEICTAPRGGNTVLTFSLTK